MVVGGASSALHQGLQGMQGSHRKIVEDADTIAKANTKGLEVDTVKDVAEPLIDMRMQQHIFDASAKVVEVASDNLGTLIDMKT
ncbi:MAG: hypothetical protein K6L73_08930 [Cellvibrionaceae bacterium]